MSSSTAGSKASPVPPLSRGWPCTCCLVLLRACREPKRCQFLPTHHASRTVSIRVMHPEVLVLVGSTMCSSPFSTVSGAIYWWKNICRKELVDFVPMYKVLPRRICVMHRVFSLSTCSKPQGCLLAYKLDLMSCLDCTQIPFPASRCLNSISVSFGHF